MTMTTGITYAFLAAVSFGASTPFAKTLVGAIAPVMLAALLYLGSGIGLLAWFCLRALDPASGQAASGRLTRADLRWLAGAIVFGGVAGPILLMLGLSRTPASAASLLLNMEGVLTSTLAWFVFRENVDRRIFAGMLLIVAGGVVLGWEQRPEFGVPWGALAIVAACLCWAIDNNLTRKISASDAVQIAGIKGLVAGLVNLGIALSLGYPLPALGAMLSAAVIGFCGYGLSLVFFVLALRNLGAARTGAYFSAAPFVGAAISLLALQEVPGSGFWIASLLMTAGIWLHLTERHVHTHTHTEMRHAHAHVHDEHHQHTHDFPWNGNEPHTHPHAHDPITHSHAHVPDIHHQHRH
jgi:drug/metabolite transporter (DMT)-like permease